MSLYQTDFAATRRRFRLPEGLVYLDGNSLGPLPAAASARLQDVVEREWGGQLIGAWNGAGWMGQPARLGDRIAALIGAEPGSVVTGDTLSLRLFQALDAALALNPERRVVLSDSGNFPSDLYMARALCRLRGEGHELRLAEPDRIAESLNREVAVLMLTEVDYRTARLHDMTALSKAAQDLGVITLWDLAHSAGALAVDLAGAGADLAVGCSYKYLNGGPGAPAFTYIAPRHQGRIDPALPGWLGHAEPFAFELAYRPAEGAARMRVGTPPILAGAVLESALEAWDGVSMADIRARSIELSELLRGLVTALGIPCASPADPAERGSHLAFRHPAAYGVVQALIRRGVVGDFRAPDLMRFGIAPLYLGEAEIRRAARELDIVITNREWDRPEYLRRQAVT
jgi:kynureninase